MPTITRVVPIERTLTTAPSTLTVCTGNSDGNCRLLKLQIQPQRPVMRVRRPIVTTTAVSGSPCSNRRIRKRSISAPSTNDTRIDSRIARISGTPHWMNEYAK